MRYLNVKNKKVRLSINRTEKKTFINKALQNNFNLGQLTKLKAILQKIIFAKTFANKTSFVNRCILSNRKKRINKIINVSRLMFLNFARFGELCGIRKAVW